MKHSNKALLMQFYASSALVIFMLIGYTAKFYEELLLAIDLPIITFIADHRSRVLTSIFTWLTKFGNGVTVIFLLLVVVAFLWQRKKKVESAWLLANCGISASVNFLIKFLFERPRPSVKHLVPATHFSFPSGHAMISIMLYGTMIIILAPYVRVNVFAKMAQVILALLIVLIGISRIYLGVHYPSDIIAGYLLALSWLGLSYPVFAKYRYKQLFHHP
ncbi:phosphatase PAP2 family protein [Vagococcus elongatus]|uniref:Phosphatidic acid phosphatase type 2/haloperoxidase domain-containing protein n=1 Tax=Vagococcus elongatus TaxID=180344 RepID=A0A430AYC8_9ENTE|nr:phosphatase PAP2 family protein [Vagococcus elongatus]RSU13080.1 hypothetical protein CBF29_05270 [Vagococcus elongatus]